MAEFGSYEAMAVNVDMIGEYTVSNIQIPGGQNSSDPLTVNGGFNGSGDQNLLNVAAGGTLPIGETFSIAFDLTFYPDFATAPFLNQAVASGDTPPNDDGTPDGDTTDDSDDGTDPDPDDEGDPDEPGENDPTPIPVPVIGIAKTATSIT